MVELFIVYYHVKNKNMYTGIIYRFTCKLNNKSYIGQTMRPERRYKDHCKAEGDSYLHNAIRSHGLNNFEYAVVESIEHEDKIEFKHILNEREKYWISYYDSYNNGYNNTLGGDGSAFWKHSCDVNKFTTNGFKGKHHSDKAKQILSEKAKERLSDPTKNGMYGKTHTPEAREKIRQSRIGKSSATKGTHLSDKTKQILSEKAKERLSDPTKNGMYGKKHTEYARNKISIASKKQWEQFKQSGKQHWNKGKHRVYNEDGTWILQ